MITVELMKKNFIESLKLVNHFADFILSKIDNKRNSIIEVVDLENFLVIKGKTDSIDVLNIQELKQEFLSGNTSEHYLKRLNNTIDLIEYDAKMDEVTEMEIILYNSQNCHYPQKTIEYSEFPFSENLSPNKFTTKSGFPFGYSLSQGRLLYYYAKHITYSIPTNFPFEKIRYKICNSNSKENFDVSLDNYYDTEESLKSAILDTFDFDMGWIENNYKKSELFYEIENPSEDFDFLKKRNSEFFII